jgi:formylmethanofuran dehydrogenase subunit C
MREKFVECETMEERISMTSGKIDGEVSFEGKVGIEMNGNELGIRGNLQEFLIV